MFYLLSSKCKIYIFQLDEIPYISVPQHAIIRAVWSNGRYHIEYIRLPVDESS